MAYKKDAVDRYQKFLNELLTIMATEGAIKKPAELAKKYGVTQAFFPYLMKRGVFTKHGNNSKTTYYKINRQTDFTLMEISKFMVDFNRHKYQLKTNGQSEENPPIRFKPGEKTLADYSTQELIDELKRRGYTGTITIIKEIKF